MTTNTTPSGADEEVRRLAEVAIRESNDGAYAVTDWQTAALKVCRATLSTAQEDALDAARYRSLRRGQKWSVTNGIGDSLRAEELDAAIDAAMKEQDHG